MTDEHSDQDQDRTDQPSDAVGAARVRTRTRRRQGGARTAPGGADAPATEDRGGAGGSRSGDGDKAGQGSGAAEGRGDAPGKGEGDAPAKGEADAAGDGEGDAPAQGGGDAAGEGGDGRSPQQRKVRRRGKRGGRGRGGRGRGGGGGDGAGAGGEEQAAGGDRASARQAGTSARGGTAAPTRQTGQRQAARRGGGGQQRRGGKGRGRAPARGMSEETRRAVSESPPRRMMVDVGEERTQIAVLEGRDLVEHYVTHRDEESLVGNIYKGRVQNVLPGMEAAFVDIGQGRNGVLYAGEVNYDEADLDGEVPRIEQTLKPGQTVMVQVTKDPMGTKGARLTQSLSIAGRYCVLAPAEGMLGISRKLPDEERQRLRSILGELQPEGFGLIVRTAAEGATREQLETDVARLVRRWEEVERRAEKAKALEPVYEEPGLVIRVIRDVFGPEYTELVIDDAVLGEDVRTYLGESSPEHAEKVQVYEGDEPLFDAYEITTQIRRALEKKVWLRSGGYLIIEKTEAMWVIDVNTGRFVGKDNLEETVLRNNIEAAEEIARQLRLRDMGGIIVIDFVDMVVPANRDEVLKRFRRELARDKTKSRVMDISKLGLVQMTRKNVSQGLTESFTTTCECCEGRGAQIVDLG